MLTGDRGIARRPAHRNLQQRFPYPDLEIGSDQHDAQRLVGAPARGVEDAGGVGRGGRHIFRIVGVRPAAGHVLEGRALAPRIVEGEAGKATVGDHDQGHAEGREMEAVADGQAGAACLVVARRHRLMRHEEIVQAPWPRHAELIGGLKQRHSAIKQPACVVQRHGLQEALRRKPRPAGEKLLQRGRRFADLRRERLQRRLVAIVETDLLDHTADGVIVASLRRDVVLQNYGAGIHDKIS